MSNSEDASMADENVGNNNGNLFEEMYNEEEVNKPISKIDDKWKLVPAFLRLRGLVK